MEYLRRSIWVLLFLLTGCGVNMPVELSGGTEPVRPDPGTFLSGSVDSSDGGVVDFGKLRDKPLVLIFAEQFCGSCAQEVMGIVKYLNENLDGAMPTSVHLVHVLVGMREPLDAQIWKKDLKIPWVVGFEPKVELMQSVCSSRQVPCTVVQIPDKGLGTPHVGLIEVEDIIKVTGPWEG